MLKQGDLIFWHGRNTIALVINIESDAVNSNKWYCLLEDGMLTHDYLEDGYTVIDANWDWPEWHVTREEYK